MFHQGDLQSAIASAIAQKKLVAVFIHSPSSPTSQTWGEEYLTANTCSGNVCGQIGSLIGEKAVLLKIEHGSQEAAFLGAFVTVENAPCLVVIRDGKVLEVIGSEVGREEFVERLGSAVGLDHDVQEDGKVGGEGEGEDEEVEEPTTAVERDVLESDPLIGSTGEVQLAEGGSGEQLPPGEQATSFPTHEATSSESTQANTLLAERARRLEADRLRREADEKAARLARKKAREDAAAASQRQTTTTTDRNEDQKARDAWVYQQKQRKEEAKLEKQRVLQQIESDRQERKLAALRRKEGAGGVGGPEFSEMLAESGSRAVAHGIPTGSCALQIRLFDGSSIKGKFAADADLATAVRTWVREASPAGGADIPYSFRQILAPKPSRTIEVGEEGRSLGDLGLVPSATLVLVPVEGAVQAYSGNGGYIGSTVNWIGSTAYAFGYSLLGAIPFFASSSSSTSTPSSGVGVRVGGATGGPYMAGTGDPQDLSNARGADMAGADGGQTGTKMRVKTLADQRAEQDRKGKENTEFYNGNSSAFQGDGDGK